MSDLFDEEHVAPSSPPSRFIRVAVERAVDQYPDGLTYAVPDAMSSGIQPGSRVAVPLGRGNTSTAGWVIEVDITPDIDPFVIKPIAARESTDPLPSQLLDLARWMSSYYAAPIGMTLAAILPTAVRKNIGVVTRTLVEINPDPPPDMALAKSQARLMAWLGEQSDEALPMDERDVAQGAGLRTVASVRRLVEKGALIATSRTTIEADWARQAVDTRIPARLTDEQRTVIHDILAARSKGFSTHLLFGVTGSGKTEVYIRLIEDVVRDGRIALVLVPEIALTPQTAGRLIGRFPRHRVAVLHSGLTAAQRHQQWTMVSRDDVDIVLGARSAVFAPIADGRLGLIVVDEEHEPSYKQDTVPRYHGRDVAIRRAQLADVPIVLGSATPSLETWHNATERRRATLHQLSRRAPGLHMPKVTVVDFQAEMRRYRDRRVHLIGPTLAGAIDETLDAGGQVLLLLNRRGFANYITCTSGNCDWVLHCDDCDVTLVYHRTRRSRDDDRPSGFVQCHHCLAQQRLPRVCPDCGSTIQTFGLGTQRVEDDVQSRWSTLVEGETLLRVDSDTMRCAADFHRALERFSTGEIRMLVGTQMIAKGLDFPGVRCVGVINADTALNLPDFRAAERTFQLVHQVAGRCGRGREPGVAIVQTFNVDDPSIRFAAAHDYPRFAREENAHRRACLLPPWGRLTRIIVRDADLGAAMTRAEHLTEKLMALRVDEEAIRIRPPAPCPIARIAGRHRVQIQILAPSAGVMQRLLAAARRHHLVHADATCAVDVDPISML